MPKFDKIKLNGIDYDIHGVVDTTLSIPGIAADAKAVGNAIGDLSDLETEEKSNLVAAINEALNSGGGDPSIRYTIATNLTHLTSSNGATSIREERPYTAVITLDEGAVLDSLDVTMNNIDITSTAWDVNTMTISIASVTGNIIITGVARIPVDTSAKIAVYDKGLNMNGGQNSYTGLCITEIYHYQQDVETLMTKSEYDSDNDYITQQNLFAPIIVNRPNTKFFELYPNASGTSNYTKNHIYSEGDVYVAYASANINYGYRNDAATWRITGVAFSLYTPDMDDSFAYWGASTTAVYPIGVRAGDIIFAGRNTQYYGLANIDGTVAGDTSSVALTLDNDVLQDFRVLRTSILGEELDPNTSNTYGTSSDLAELINTVKNAWMIEYGGDYRKIPLIISTDQHGRRHPGIFKQLAKTLSLHDVSKICNLGDTVAVEWVDSDSEHPLLSDATLELWCESIKDIPFSKRLDVYGNHDAWYYDGYSVSGNPIGTRYPSSMAHLDQYFRNIYARRTNNHGWSVIIDDYFNVKYMIVTGFEWIDGRSNNRISTAQMTYIIDEFSKNDGYDIVVMSHVPLYCVYGNGTLERVSALNTDALFNARKNKTSGTITDSDGVSHSYDFTGCTTDILCGLNGHTHEDITNYVGGSSSGLLSLSLDWFAGYKVHFILLDRVNRLVNVWKMNGSELTYTNYQVPFDNPN